MLRFAYALGTGYLLVCGLALAHRGEDPAPRQVYFPHVEQVPPPVQVEYVDEPPAPPAPPPPRSIAATSWFDAIRPRCNAVEVEVALRNTPPPRGNAHAGHVAACYALAGKIQQAKRVIDALPASARPQAAAVVFGVAHPVADAGDDSSAGPMMRLVLEYAPENFQALYHAGMSEYMMGELPRSRTHLRHFLEIYKNDDGWTRNARDVLSRGPMKRLGP
jgi:hypothetical protein